MEGVTVGADDNLTSIPSRSFPVRAYRSSSAPCVRSPIVEITARGGELLHHQFQYQSFPGTAPGRVHIQRRGVGNAEQMVRKARIPQVRLRRFDLAFLQVRMPGRQLPDDQRIRKDVQVPAHRGIGDAEGATEFR